MYLDIHSHIIPQVDDGAKDMTEALKLVKLCKKNNISDIIATPHFYPNEMGLEDFLKNADRHFEQLRERVQKIKEINIYKGCEILYFRGLGDVEEIQKLTLNNSKYLLIEIVSTDIKKHFFDDILSLKERGFKPIIAHIERYHRFVGFRKLLKFVKEEKIAVQINASSVLSRHYKGVIKKLFNSSVFCVLATDTHSCLHRPPFMNEAMELVGEKIRKSLIENSKLLYNEIIGDKIAE